MAIIVIMLIFLWVVWSHWPKIHWAKPPKEIPTEQVDERFRTLLYGIGVTQFHLINGDTVAILEKPWLNVHYIRWTGRKALLYDQFYNVVGEVK